MRTEEENIDEEKEVQTNAKGRESHDRTSERVGTDHALGSGFSQEDATGTRTVQSHPLSAEGVAKVGECEFRGLMMFLF